MDDVLWLPSCSIDNLQFRATCIKQIRSFFDERQYLEVETPVMAQFGVTDVYLSNIKASFRGMNYSLQTSPEYHMKRLLAAGSGSIYQLARVFRDDEFGRWHNPEFTLLEWYRLDATHHDLMAEMDLFLQTLLTCSPLIKKTYQEAFYEACQFDPFIFEKPLWDAVLLKYDLDNVLSEEDKEDPSLYLFLLMSHVVEPYLAKTYAAPVAVYDFPPEQAALSRIIDGKAARFEVYYQGIELANGFYELIDVNEQLARFESDNHLRKKKNLPQLPVDTYFLAALKNGLPECTGVALGVDRLIALKAKADSIAEVLSFSFDRA